MGSSLENLAQAIRAIGADTGPVRPAFAAAAQAGRRLAGQVPTGNGTGASVTVALRQATSAAAAAEAALASFAKRSEAFADRLADGHHAAIVQTGSRDSAQVPTGALNAELQSIYSQSQSTSAGRAFYTSGDAAMFAAAQSLRPMPGMFVVDMHGRSDSVQVGDAMLSASELAELIRCDPAWKGQHIFLLSCETGQGDTPVAQGLANHLGVGVTAPDELGWSSTLPGGNPWSATGHFNASGNFVSTDPPDGHFLTFNPKR